ncbi:MAG: DMT family transporter [Bacteroidetes bacterium]|nr:DMT family transporter [Bacteroidota bacterium]
MPNKFIRYFCAMRGDSVPEPTLNNFSTSKSISAENWLIYFGLSFIWGFSFYFIKMGLTFFTSLEVAAFRMSIALLAFLPFLFKYRKRLKIKKQKVKWIPVLGFLGNLIPAVMFSIAAKRIDSALLGILNATTPLFALGIGSLLFGVLLTGNKIIGVILGFIGSMLIILSTQSVTSLNLYILLPLVATMSYGMNANIFKVYFQDDDPLVIALLQYAFVGIITFSFLLFNGTFQKITLQPDLAWQALKYLLLLGVLGTAVAQIYFNILTQKTSALFATMTTFTIPIVAVIIGIVIGEQLTLSHFVGLTIILVGVYVGSRK